MFELDGISGLERNYRNSYPSNFRVDLPAVNIFDISYCWIAACFLTVMYGAGGLIMKEVNWHFVRKCASMAKSRSGNFAIAFALLAPVLFAVASVSIDFARIMQKKTEMAGIADSAALAASSAMADKGISAADAKALAIRYIDGQLSTKLGTNGNSNTQFANIAISDTLNAKGVHIYDVKVNIGYQVHMSDISDLIAQTDPIIQVNSTSRSSTGATSQGAMSMYFVLDRSGSMHQKTSTLASQSKGCQQATLNSMGNGGNAACKSTYLTKISALQLAVQTLATQLTAADPSGMYVRTGGESFNSSPQKPTPLNWGTNGLVNYVNALTARGGTDSSKPMDDAYQILKTSNEDAQHLHKNGMKPKKYIVFMTDGENNKTSSDTATEATCDAAKKKGIEIYTIALMAPARGQQLLTYCATDKSHYFDAQDANGLFAAFANIGKAAASSMSLLTN